MRRRPAFHSNIASPDNNRRFEILSIQAAATGDVEQLLRCIRGFGYTSEKLDIATMKYMERLLSKQEMGNHLTCLRDLGYAGMRKVTPKQRSDIAYHSSEVDDALDYWDCMKTKNAELSTALEILSMTLVMAPKLLKKYLASEACSVSKLVVYVYVKNTMRRNREMTVGPTETRKAQMLQALCTKEPLLAALLLETKNVATFMLFCSMFSKKTIEFPDVADVEKLITAGATKSPTKPAMRYLAAANKIEEGAEGRPMILETFIRTSVEALVTMQAATGDAIASKVADATLAELLTIYRATTKAGTM